MATNSQTSVSPANHAAAEPLAGFHACTRTWFDEAFESPTKAQRQAWPPIGRGESTLLLAPTGSGKTLAAFLASLDRLMFRQANNEKFSGVRVLYVSPLKALGVDIDRNLRAPIAGIRAVAERTQQPIHVPTVAIRSGDTSAKERVQIARQPPEILITTPESLYLMLTSKASEILAQVETVIIDEIHVMVPTKRGVHLFLTLERLERLRRTSNPAPPPLQRLGLSATQRPLDEIARLLGGAEATSDPDEPPRARPVTIVDASEPKRFELRVETPVEDMTQLGQVTEPSGNAAMGPAPPSIWASIHPRLLELIRSHRSTMIFVNSRRLAERLAGAINELAEEEVALAHHGSVAKDQRRAIEDRLKRGMLPAIVATSSLELGIDMGAVDLVVQIEAPPTIAAGIQRIGRSGRGVHLLSRGVIFPKYRGDLLACAGATRRMLTGRVEETYYPRNPLDLLAQQIVAIVSREPISTDELYATIRGASPYAELPPQLFEDVLDLLSGRYPSDEFSGLRPRITWDRHSGIVSPRRGAQRLAILNGGTIPDRGLYGVFLVGEGEDGTGGARVGELDEEMVFETHAGDVFLLGASSWRVVDITKDRVLVAPAPGEPGKMPFWRGDGPGRPLEFGRAVGQLSRELATRSQETALTGLQSDHALDSQAARNLWDYVQGQCEATEEPPSDRTIIVESFLDEIGDWRVCVLSPFGARVHAPWAMAVAARLREEGFVEVDLMWTDDGMTFRLPESAEPPPAELFIPPSEDVEELVTRQLGSTALFSAHFRENAARALLLPKRQPHRRTPLWLQRRKAADLLAAASHYPQFPILLETYRECLRDVFDLPGLMELLQDVSQHRIRIHAVTTVKPSPFAAALLFNYIGNFIYEGDAPLAERRAQALALDHERLSELLGSTNLRELLDADIIEQLELELQHLLRPRAKDADDLHDLLLLLGDLSHQELSDRCFAEISADELDKLLTQLLQARRTISIRIGGQLRYAAAEDAARFRDALGTNCPTGLPEAFLDAVSDPLGDLISRFARTHGPFSAAQAAERFSLGEAPVRNALMRLMEAGRVTQGEFVPGSRGAEWCDVGVLRHIKRRTMAKLRKQIEPASAEAFARFLPTWQGVTRPRRGLDGVLDAVENLQGAPLPATTLEREILTARVSDYQAGYLDQLCLAGEIVWQGIEGLGATDGRIALYLTDRFELLARQPATLAADAPDGESLVGRIRNLLASRGALLFDDISRELGAFPHDVLASLWQLVWNGELTNDTLAPLRSLAGNAHVADRQRDAGRRRHRRLPTFRTRRRNRLPGSEGRWSLLARLVREEPSATERQIALAEQLLDRYGILTREVVTREQVPGGFAAIYPILKAMEEAGKVRRGYFVEGMGGAQFAMRGADELLRDQDRHEKEGPLALAATDPANAYGVALPWPKTDATKTSFQRVPRARVILHEGRLLGYLRRNTAALDTTLAPTEPQKSADAERLVEALTELASHTRGITLAKIDDQPPGQSSLSQKLIRSGFNATSRGYVYRDPARQRTVQATVESEK